ncbi:hypothetical protein [Aneurinibacillus tyrosinisolvens]|uniref:hypothetical protein n=1 Tax=Aneurinibacillus tyrosinisolvens TaxID=1443435 RepID=UPI00063F44E4|nr:hypothetical protein [Aneurinibacillus tyrosinisolvens]
MKVLPVKKSVVTVVLAIAIMMLGSVALAASINEKKMMSAMHELDIIGLTDELVGLTGNMLDDTNNLSGKIGEVGHSLSMLDVQKDELSKQVQTNGEIIGQLDKQLELNKEARGLMQQILSIQGETQQLTTNVAGQASTATGQVVKTADQLAGVGTTTGQMNASTVKLSNQLDQLNHELGLAADSFRLVGKLTALLNALPIPVGDTVRSVANTAQKTVQNAGKTVNDLVKNPTDVNKTAGNVGKTVNDTVSGVTDTVGKVLPGVIGGNKQKEPGQGTENKQEESKGLLPGLKLPLLGGSGE